MLLASRGTDTEPDIEPDMANLHHHDTLDPEVRYLPAPQRRRPNVLVQAGWGLWDMLLRLVEYSVKLLGAAVIVVVLLVAAVIWGWNHVVEAGVDKLQDVSTTTTTP